MKVLGSKSVPPFNVNLRSAQKYRDFHNKEHDFLNEFFYVTFVPYIRGILARHPDYTPESLEQHIKVDVTELSEAIFSASNVYHLYLDTIAHKYLVEHPDELDSIVQTVQSPLYDTFEKIDASIYADTFKGSLMSYVLELLPAYNEEYSQYLAYLPVGYYDSIEAEKRKGTSPKVILDEITKRYKKEYNCNFLNLTDFTKSARIAVYGLQEYLRTDKPILDKCLRSSLTNSILQLNSQFDKFGFTKKAQEIRRNNLRKMGIEDLADILDAGAPKTSEQLLGAINSSSIPDLVVYNTALTNRYSKESDSLAESLFVTYQYGILDKFFDPEVQKFFSLKDAIDNHTETDLSVQYVIDKDSSYPTKADLFKILKLLYSKASYTVLASKISPLPEARKDPNKVSVPGLIHEIKQIYPTREEFEKGIAAIQDFFPVAPEYKIALEKMSFLRNPTKLYMQDIQRQVAASPDEFETHLTPEEELEVFGNISNNPDIIRYSYRPYQKFMQATYGRDYKSYYDNKFKELPKYQDVPKAKLPRSDISIDAQRYLRFYTPIFYSYEFKDDLINSLVALIVIEKEFANAGLIVDSVSPDGTTADIDWKTGLGIDSTLTSSLIVHAMKEPIQRFLLEYTGDTILPEYVGMHDFDGISNQNPYPFNKKLVKEVKRILQRPDLSPEAKTYLSRLLSFGTGQIPEHLCEPTTNKKKKPKFKRIYTDIKTGKRHELVNGVYVPLSPVEEVQTKTPTIVAARTFSEGDDYEL